MQIIELYIKTGGYNGTGTAINTSSISDFSIDFIEVGAKIGDSIYFPSLNLTSTITVVNQNNISINDSILTANDLTKYEIVAQWDKLDLFKDESVSITDSIKNLKDPSKIFTAFSQQFNVPASKNNSKIFKHYENANVVNSFDARFKADALIKLNGADYKKGKLKLNGVSLKDNSPNSYKLVFFGETVELKDLLNDRELSSLNYPESLNFDYDYANLKSKLTTDPESLDVCVPLITHTKNMRYSNNGYTDEITGNYLSPFDLKPAIKVRRIIEAIQDTIPQIQFSNEFLNTTDFNNLWLWLHREKGFSASADEGGGRTIITNRFGYLDDNPNNFELVSGDEVRPSYIAFSSDWIFGYNRFVNMEFSIQTSSPSQQFTLLIRRASDNQVIIEEDYTGSTNYNFTHTLNFVNYGQGICDVFIDLISDDSFNILSYQNVVTGFKAIDYFTYTEFTGTYNAPNLSLSNKFIVGNQMPKMKVIDFLTNIFKMFNLVAFKDGDKMKVLPLNDFYSDGVTYEVTKYIDSNKSSVEKLQQFKNIIFDFKSKKSFLVQKAEEINGVKFAHEQVGNNDWDGGKYDITLDFEKMMYERLNNEDTGSLSDIGQGAMLDKEFKPTIGKPLLLYIDRQYAPNQIQLYNGTDLENISFYNRPSQVYVNPSSVVTSSSSSLNFGAEIDEFFRLQIGTDLFTKYYLDYIEGIFDRQGRILKVSSYLPLSIILKLKLNDTFSIANSLYRINSIKTNLLTNKSSLELYSLLENPTSINNEEVGFLTRVTGLAPTTKTASTINFEWESLSSEPNLNRFEVYIDDVLNKSYGSAVTSGGVVGLNSNITYKISLRPIYQINSVEVAAIPTNLFETTL
jgi:hypothetical protein